MGSEMCIRDSGWQEADPADFRKPVGCEECFHTGYRGRFAIVEYLACDDAVRQVLQSGGVAALRDFLKSSGHVSLMEDGLRRAAAGDTSLDEVLRVAG